MRQPSIEEVAGVPNTSGGRKAKVVIRLPVPVSRATASMDVNGDGQVTKTEYLRTLERDAVLFDTFTEYIAITVRRVAHCSCPPPHACAAPALDRVHHARVDTSSLRCP